MTIDTTADAVTQYSQNIDPEYVERERRSLSKYSKLRAIHWFAVFMSLVLTFSIWQYSRMQITLRTEARFASAADQVAELIEERLQKYELALWGGVAAMRTHDNLLDFEKWQTFAANLEIEDRYPGINGIGVIHQIKEEDLESYLNEQQRSRPSYRIHPPHDGNIYQPITLIEPVDINIEAVGLDMVHEANRHTALNQARDTGSAQITGPIVLVQDASKKPGFLFFAPYYATDSHDTLEKRRAQFTGAIYAPFVVHKLLDGVLNKDRRTTAIRITDGDQVIYDEINNEDADYDVNSLGERKISMNFYGREWVLDIRAGLNFRADNSGIESIALLCAGLLVDLSLLMIFIVLTRANRRGIAFADMATSALDGEARALQITNAELIVARKEAENVSEMKSQFLSTISHEVRTPLTAISGILVLLARADLPAKQEKLVKAGKTASENLIKLLTDVLDSSRLEANAVELLERDIAIKPLVTEWQTLARGMISKLEKDISIVAHVSDDTPAKIYADDIRVSQLLNNLMDNAIRFTEQGEIAIKTYPIAATQNDPEMLVIAIEDSGIGIAQSDLGLIFERYRQVDGSITRERGGAGLGLAISYDLAQLLGGDLKVTSELGKGTVFELHLPTRGYNARGKHLE
ncbi:CHASE domain-containing protein [Planktotalea sp.]|uniref:CHASE domain-containing protein n=1 Tax=Planktotalea sp. TaxID=2029877 RepID=UPI003F6B772E